jgi:hypothetical protein
MRSESLGLSVSLQHAATLAVDGETPLFFSARMNVVSEW